MGAHVESAHLARLSCALWGHVVNNEVFRRAAGQARRCRCGSAYLAEDGTLTHVRHTLSCCLRHHTYTRLADRDGVHEYVCVRCGHPLVYPASADPFASRERFAKKARYTCGLLGHRVRALVERDGFVEYACHCGQELPEIHPRGAEGPSSADLLLHGASHPVPRPPLRFRGIRLHRLRPSVLLRRSDYSTRTAAAGAGLCQPGSTPRSSSR